MNGVMSLRNYIDNRNNINYSVKIETFCKLMQKVSEAIEKEQRNLIRINLDEININIYNNEIIFPDHLFSSDLDKTIANFNTGVSVMADRKSTKENRKVAFALMVLGWYVNPKGNAINSDIDVLEHFEEYMNKVPNWLKEYFINIFRRMDYSVSFNDYYKTNIIDKAKNDIKELFIPYNLNSDQLNRITALIIKETIKTVREGEQNA